MKISSIIALRPICFFFMLVLIVLLIPSFVVYFWVLMGKRVEEAAKTSSYYLHNETFSGVETAANLLFPINTSAVNLAKILHSSLNGTLPALPAIENKVAPYLYLALKTLPLSQITFLGSNGVFYSYYIEGNQTFVTYSNASTASVFTGTPNASVVYNCLTEQVDVDNGRRTGNVKSFHSKIFIKSSWLEEAMKSSNAYASLDKSWGKSNEQVFKSTTSIHGVGLISLGLSVKAFSDSISKMDLNGGELYLIAKNGTSLAQTGNLRIMINNDKVSIDDYTTSFPSIDITCEPSDNPLRKIHAHISGSSYLLYCKQFEIAGVPTASVMVFPDNGYLKLVHKHNKLALTLLLILLASVLLSIFFFIFLIVKNARREILISAALIKQKEATQQAERKSMNKTHAFSSTSHDMRSSLAILDGLISLCCADVSPKSELHKNLQQMKSCVADLVGLLNSVLDTSKIEAGKMQLMEEEFDIAQVLEDTANFYYPVAHKKGVDVILDPCDRSVLKHCLVKGDRGKFKQILNNLLHNAIKFTNEGSVSIRAWVKKPSLGNQILSSRNSSAWSFFSQLVYKNTEALSSLDVLQQQLNSIEFIVEVDDTGKGIPKDKQKSVFEDFVQVAGTSLEHGGTGLGLGIVQSLVRLMGGEIRIVDKKYVGDRGTCFRFNVLFSTAKTASNFTERENVKLLDDPVPTESLHHQLERNTRSPSPTAEGSNIVLLIQGDERRRMLQKFFQSLGAKVWTPDSLEHLASTLKRIKCKWHPNLSSSGKYEMDSFSGNSFDSGTKDVSMSARDGMDDLRAIYKKTGSRSSNSGFVLIVNDYSGANFSDDRFVELSSILESFKRDTYHSRCKIVWLYTPHPDLQRRRLEERLAHSELVMTNPLHGSRLHEVVRLLPEFGGAQTIEGYNPNLIRQSGPFLEASSSSHVRSSYASLKSHKEHEIQPVYPNSDKPLEGKNVLLVEDDRILCLIENQILTRLGASTVCCKDGAEALNQVRKAFEEMNLHGASKIFPFSCILMDCEMPMMTGYEATSKIRIEERPYGLHIPIIALTAHAVAEAEAKIKAAGMDYHLTKPLEEDKLLKIIKSIGNVEKN